MNLGPLDKRVRVERKVKTRNAVDNSVVLTWELVRNARASIEDELQPTSMAERTDGGVRIATGSSKVRMRWFSGLTPDMRLVRIDDCSNRVMNITSVAEVGRREGWLCAVETYSTEGQGG